MLDEIQNFLSLEYWQNFLKSPTKKRLAENFFSLSILQGLNYILPLITLPYLVRVLGVEKFGFIAFAQAFLGYFVIIVTYGFDLLAPREISIFKENKKKVSEIFSVVIISKIILAIASFFLLLAIVFLVPKFKLFLFFYLLMFEIVIWSVIFPVWFFQGIEKMKFITIIAFLSKFITVIFIFILIKKPSDYILYPVVDFIGNIIAGIWAGKIIFKDFKIIFSVPSWKTIKQYLKDGFFIFTANISISLYNNSNTFILGLLTNNTLVGYYSAAEKIINAIKGLISPVSTAIYPYISKAMHESKEKGFAIAKKVLLINSIFFGIIGIIIFLLAPLIVKIVLGPKYLSSIIILRIFSLIPFIVAINNVLGLQTIPTQGYFSEFSKIFLKGSIVGIVLSIFLTILFKHIGMAFAWVIAEIFVVILMIHFHKKKNTLLLFF
jgi:PST family polysaccharide transporter